MSGTDWLNPSSLVTDHFTVKEACWLPSWNRLATPSAPEQAHLVATCTMMEAVRDALASSIIVHVMLRPAAYNAAIGGALHSAHIWGGAVDFSVKGMDCDRVRELLEPLLESLGARMERNPGANWVHLDRAPPNPHRYFTP